MGRYFAVAGAVALVATFVYGYFFSGYPEARELPILTALSFSRISLVFFASLAVGISVGIAAARYKAAGRVIIPVFDILQSVPVLGYFPILLVTIVLAFPGLVGRELGAMVLLFTAMEWSIFFGVVGAVKAIPQTVAEAASGFGLRGRAYLRNVVLPAIVPALLSASTLAWNDGWTFDVVSEFVRYGHATYSVEGLGAFIEKSSSAPGTLGAGWLGLLVMGEVVVITNQAVWHRLSDMAARHRGRLAFHVPERVAHPLRAVGSQGRRAFGLRFRVELLHRVRVKYGFSTRVVGAAFGTGLLLVVLVAGLSYLVPELSFLRSTVTGQGLASIPLFTLFTLARMAGVYFLCLLLSISVALLVARRKGVIRYFYVVYDFGRAIPYLALFPPLFGTLLLLMPGGLGLEVSSVFLLFMGMIWYIIFNVVSAASFLPAELGEVSALFGFKGWKMVRHVLIPAITPAIITGSILAWGGGWNVVIYSEYVTYQSSTYSMPGLGSLLDEAAAAGNSALVVIYLFVMSGIVILLGRLVWRRLLRKVERRGVELQ